MDNFTTNIELGSADLAVMVSHIHIPEGMALLGVLPILAIIFGTDNVQAISEKIRSLNSKQKTILNSKVHNTVVDSKYPLTRSVWQFNDPSNDISALSHALTDTSPHAMLDFQQFLNLYTDTFPFINTHFEELDPLSVLEVCEDYEVRARPFESRSNPPQTREIGPSAFIVPSVAVGSLMLLSSKLKNIPGSTL